jgi:2,3-bisphosphoglycerate-independent phosphoglycerate mutase
VPPHDLTGRPALLPTGPAAAKLIDLMDASKPVVRAAAAEVGSVATQIWLWGQGTRPQLPDFTARYGVPGRLSSAVDLVRGLGVLSGIEVLDVPGATAGFDNDYGAQRDAALKSLEDRDFFLLHVEATDEAGHQGAIDEKVTSLERWDAEIIGPIVDALGDAPYRILLLPDHATPCAARTHTSDPVPYLLFDSSVANSSFEGSSLESSSLESTGGEYSERGVAGRVPVPAHELMARLVG